MNASSRTRLPGAIGVLIGFAVVAAFATDVTPSSSGALSQHLLDYASLGRAVGEFIALGFSLALLAFGLRRLTARKIEVCRAGLHEASIASDTVQAAAAITVPLITDGTSSEFDDSKLPGFAPVVSLTEAQVERQRAERQRQKRRMALTRA